MWRIIGGLSVIGVLYGCPEVTTEPPKTDTQAQDTTSIGDTLPADVALDISSDTAMPDASISGDSSPEDTADTASPEDGLTPDTADVVDVQDIPAPPKDVAGEDTPDLDVGPPMKGVPGWFQSFGGIGHDEIKAVAADSQGNVYVTGIYRETIVIGSEVFEAQEPGENMPDTFVASFDAKGDFRWAHAFGGLKADIPFEITVDGQDNVYVAGSHHKDLTIGNVNLTTHGGTDIFVVAYDSLGNQKWAKNWGGPFGDTPRSLSVNALGDIFITGSYNGLIEVDDLSFGSAESFGLSEIFVFAIDGSTQQALWLTTFTGTGHDVGTAIVADEERNVVVAISYQHDLKLDDEADLSFNSGGMNFNVGLVRLNHKGEVLWAKPFTSVGSTEILGLDQDESGDIYFGGLFSGTSNFGGSDLLGNDGLDIMVARYDESGNHIWSVEYSGDSFDQALDLEVSGTGIYLTGRFKAELDFGVTELSSSGDNYDVFVSRLSIFDGECMWAESIGSEEEDQGNGIGVSPDGSVFVGGHTKGEMNFNGIPYLLPGTPLDTFILKFSQAEDP